MKIKKVRAIPFVGKPAIMEGHSRGRKIHLTLDNKKTLCNLKVEEEWEEGEVDNGICKNCLIPLNRSTQT